MSPPDENAGAGTMPDPDAIFHAHTAAGDQPDANAMLGSEYTALAQVIDWRIDERVSINHDVPSAGIPFSSKVIPVVEAPAYLASLPAKANIWHSVNTLRDGVIKGRGKAIDVVRLTTLWADIDVAYHDGGCPDMSTAWKVIEAISDPLGQHPTAVVHSGHGLQPYWRIDGGTITEFFTIADADDLVKRFGRLVASVAAQYDIAVMDGVFDLPRVLRTPGSINNKKGFEPTPTRLIQLKEPGAGLDLYKLGQVLENYDEEPSKPSGKNCGSAGFTSVAAGGTDRRSEYVKAAYFGELADLGSCPDGGGKYADPPTSKPGRNNHCNISVLKLAGLPGVDQDQLFADALAEMHNNGAVADNGLAAAEATIRSALAYATLQPPRGVPESKPVNPAYSFDPADVSSEPTPANVVTVEHLDAGFWQSRESLRLIYDAALARMCSPWAVLAYCAARAITLVSPDVKLPALIGGPGSLNLFAAIVAGSGGGKGAAAALAKVLVPAVMRICNPGSGEGVIQAYIERDDKGKIVGKRQAVMFDASEIDSVAALSGRSGATLMPVVRSGFSGENLGFGYADQAKAQQLEAHTYRMTMVVAVQPARSAFLFNDVGGGTPQRFMWFPAIDPRITADAFTHWQPGKLTLPKAQELQLPREVDIPHEAGALIRTERVKAMRGEQDALDGHALFCREKFAYALAVLDGRMEMTLEDWQLSGIAADVSTLVRGQVERELLAGLRDEAARAGSLRGVAMESADAAKAEAYQHRVNRVQRGILRRLDAAPDGVKRRDLTQAAGRDHGVVKAALDQLAERELIEVLSDGVTWRRKP